MTQMEEAQANFDKASKHLEEVMLQSCKALHKAGFRLTYCEDPLREAIWKEVEKEGGKWWVFYSSPSTALWCSSTLVNSRKALSTW